MSGIGVGSEREIVANSELWKPPDVAIGPPGKGQYCASHSRLLYVCVQNKVYHCTGVNVGEKRVGGDCHTWWVLKKDAVHKLAKEDQFFGK